MPFSQIIPPSPSPSESKSPLYTSVSFFLSCIQGCHCHLSKFHLYVLVYCIGVFLSRIKSKELSRNAIRERFQCIYIGKKPSPLQRQTGGRYDITQACRLKAYFRRMLASCSNEKHMGRIIAQKQAVLLIAQHRAAWKQSATLSSDITNHPKDELMVAAAIYSLSKMITRHDEACNKPHQLRWHEYLS